MSAKLADVVLGCVDIGSNTTRLLVADVAEGGLEPRLQHRAYTRLGAGTGKIPQEKLAATAAACAAQVEQARAAGAQRIEVVATAAVRNAANGGAVCAAVEAGCGIAPRVLSAADEARLAFLGATRTIDLGEQDGVAVIDVGGGSTEIAVGAASGAPEWWASLSIGSGALTERHIARDPPTTEELEAVRGAIDVALDGLEPPPVRCAAAVGGTATSLLRVAGACLDADALEGRLAHLCRTPVEPAAAELGLDPARVRLLPAGILILQGIARLFAQPLHVACGGVREGVILELAETP